MQITGICAGIGLILFILIMLKDRRTLWSGVFLFITTFLFAIYIILLAEEKHILESGNFILAIFFFILIALVALIALLGFAIVGGWLIYNGVKILKKEGKKLHNMLSLTLGVGIIANFILGRAIFHMLEKESLLYYLYVYFNVLLFYFILITSAYLISSWINFINIGKKNLSYVVVLGCGLNKRKVTPLLAGRINKGIEVYKKNKGCKMIMSGGKGEDEEISEAEAMKEYAIVERQIPESDIFIENQSRNTAENIRFSKTLMKNGEKFAIVTNYYHLFRALLIAKEEKISCIGYGAKTKTYFSLNAFIRELIGYLYLKRKLHIVSVILITLVFIGQIIFRKMIGI
ncbi:TPA: YdcF family protein [Streptococcus equi subsp. zooepidemicus]|nr:YdcF family protein [Streptococcus equi subsp. zooepidemicus]